MGTHPALVDYLVILLISITWQSSSALPGVSMCFTGSLEGRKQNNTGGREEICGLMESERCWAFMVMLISGRPLAGLSLDPATLPLLASLQTPASCTTTRSHQLHSAQLSLSLLS